ncbi:MAG TPA: choice-of-anchor D domain-containing protein [Candidatus Kapabacteria bacterium]|nr:choice-of-anchor D domain-containing protein [Candidatus Kapabacteria bacterium]
MASALHAQGSGAGFGRRFIVAFPDTVRPSIGGYVNPARQDAGFILFSNQTAQVTITAPGYHRDITVSPDASFTVWLAGDTSAPARWFLDTVNTPVPDVFTITSDQPIGVTCYYVTHQGSEAFTPLPVERWGTEYSAASQRADIYFSVEPPEETLDWAMAPCQMIVLAAENGTDVTVNARAEIYTVDKSVVRDTVFHLNAGEAVLVETAAPWDPKDTSARDFSGTRIVANKPVGVISGNTRTKGGEGAYVALPSTTTGNSLDNTAVEWLAPADSQGTTFVYAPIAGAGTDRFEELIRVYATSPGITTVTLSRNYPQAVLRQDSFVVYSYSRTKTAPGTFGEPFAIRTDRPAQATVLTGSYGVAVPQTVGDVLFESYAPAMSLMPPRESWFNSARFHSPLYPPYLTHSVLLTADSTAELWLDGKRITIQPTPIKGAPFVEVLLEVTAGDHSIRSVHGRCGAIAFGQAKGLEGFTPTGTYRRDDGSTPPPMPHPSKYTEDISIAYAYPVTGLLEESLPNDSLVITRNERCDSTIVSIVRIGESWTFVPYTVTTDPASANMNAEVTSVWNGQFAGYTIRFTPQNPLADADGAVILTAANGRSWRIPYSYRAWALAVTPNPIELLDVKIGVEQTLELTLTNQRPFILTPLEIKLRNGTNGFSLRNVSTGMPLRPGETDSVTLAFTGAAKNTEYTDTLEVTTDCGTFLVPVRAHTGPYPIPAITGYDWKARLVGTTNDTLSWVSNRGSVSYSIRSITIDADAAGAFGLTAPNWQAIGPVGPAGTDSLGIGFHPASQGTFTAHLVMVTTDGDSATAELRGVGIMPLIDAPDRGGLGLCADSTLDTAVIFTNSGSAPLAITGVTAGGGGIVSALIDSSAGPHPFLPRTLAPGDTLRVPLHLHANATGSFGIAITASSGAFGGDSVALVAGSVAACVQPLLVVDNHDFGPVYITLTKGGFVTLRNIGTVDATIQGMTIVDDAENSFALGSQAVPFVLHAGDSARIPATFTPPTRGPKSAHIAFTTDAGPLLSTLSGAGIVLTVPAMIRRDYHAPPGEAVTIRVELQGRLDTLPIHHLDIHVEFAPSLLAYLAAVPDSAARRGWQWSATPGTGALNCTIDPGIAPPDTGTLLSIRLLAQFDLLTRSELPFTIGTDLPYVDVVESPGLFTRDPLCGLLERLISFSTSNFALDQNVPNPLTGEGSIAFEIPFENETQLTVFDALGNLALTLVDARLKPGRYAAHIPAGALGSGLYYYRLRSGQFVAVRKMAVQ